MYFSLKTKTGKHFFFGPCCVSLIREITVLRLFEMGVRGCVNINNIISQKKNYSLYKTISS